jgi:sulfate transport system permease protein
VLTFLTIVVALPIAALVWSSTQNGADAFWDVVTSPQALAALKLSLLMAAAAALTNGVLGTLIAWMLVRDDFRGKGFVNAVIDLPFALPTIVVGLVIISLYGIQTPLDLDLGLVHFTADVTFSRWAIYMALLFVTLPFVVRTVQPVLLELDTEMEETARSLGAGNVATFRRIVLPNILPGILSGLTMAFARAVGEVGSLILITGNLPFETEVASVFIYQRIDGDPHGAAAVSVVLLGISFAVLLLVGGLRRSATRHDRG